MKKIFFIIIFSFLLISCLNEKKEIYYPSGKLQMETTIKNGKMNGPAKTYFENGQLQWEGILVNDLKDGLAIKYYANGKKESEIFYKNGIENGPIKTYHENGKLKATAFMIDGKENGISKEFFENGELKSEGNYVNGLAEGELEIYHPNMQLEMVAVMENDKPIYFKQFDPNGKEIKEHREVKTNISSNIINVGETFVAKLSLTGPSDGVSIQAFGGEAKEGKEINFMGKLPMNNGGITYSYTGKEPGVYYWRIWFDCREADNKVKKYSYEGQFEVKGQKS